MRSLRIWSYWAARYERLMVQRLVLEPSRRLVTQRLNEVNPDARRILDLGCGVGQLAQEIALARPQADIVACDPTPEMIARAIADHGAPNIRYVPGDVSSVLGLSPFDVVLCTNVLPYVPDKLACIRAIHAMLRPGGDALILHANANTLYDAFILSMVKLTVSRAEYLPTAALASLLRTAGFQVAGTGAIPWRPLVPSVTLVHGRKP